MDAPKCRLCEQTHWGSCGSVQPKASPQKKSRKPARSEKKSFTVDARSDAMKSEALVVELLARVESLESRLDALDRRREYQRNLMRKRRAKEKE